MYKIMLADDEGIVIDSPEVYYIERICRRLRDRVGQNLSRSVIELAESFPTGYCRYMDIQMPGINGIDAMREIKPPI